MSTHIEIHILETAQDCTAATEAGLPDTSGIRTCPSCGNALASRTEFIPRAVILEGYDNEWVRCLSCLSNVVTLLPPRN